jgi:hypothetical protein
VVGTVSLAIWEVEIRRLQFEASPVTIVGETLSPNNQTKWNGGVA